MGCEEPKSHGIGRWTHVNVMLLHLPLTLAEEVIFYVASVCVYVRPFVLYRLNRWT